MPETESTIIAVGLIIVVIFLIMPQGAITKIIDFIANRPKQIKMQPKDLFQRFYKQRLRIARAQRDRDTKGIICSGDKETKSKRFKRVRGCISDIRCIEFFVKLHWYQVTPSWLLVPSEFVTNLLSPIPVIKARGLRNQGAYYIPILRLEDKDKEETMKDFIHEYVKNLMAHEQAELVAEQEINNLFDAISPPPVPMYIAQGHDISVQGAEESEPGD